MLACLAMFPDRPFFRAKIAINKNPLTKMLEISVFNMSQWQLSQTSKWYHCQPYGIFEIPG